MPGEMARANGPLGTYFEGCFNTLNSLLYSDIDINLFDLELKVASQNCFVLELQSLDLRCCVNNPFPLVVPL